MKPQDFVRQLDETNIRRAIQDAERQTSGEIRVFVTSRQVGGGDIVARAVSRFEKLGMTATRDRNAVLLYFAPRSQQFAVIGDKGVHEKLGDLFWQEVVSAIREKLASGTLTDAVVVGITLVRDALAHHFPRRSDDRNELPNEIERD